MEKKLSINQVVPKIGLNIQPPVNESVRDMFIRNYKPIIDYDIILSNGKPLQRELVWDITQKRNLIISMLKDLQMPDFCVVEYNSEVKGEKPIYKIVDGKQRLSTVESFYNNEFALLVDGVEYYFRDFDEEATRIFLRYSFKIKKVHEYSNKKLSDAELIGWFELVNFAGTQQDINHIENLKS